MQKSPLLICRGKSSLLVVDLQGRLVPVIENYLGIAENIARLNESAKLFAVPRTVSEQYPKGLGATISDINIDGAKIFEKTSFSCREQAGLFAELADSGRSQVVVTGIEAHICVLQTCLDLVGSGFQVFIVVDAIGSRKELDYKNAITRMANSGAIPVTTESVLFEWCETSMHENFKAISKLVK